MQTQQARRILFGVVTTVIFVFGAAPIQVGSAASNRDASAIAALDAIPAEDWLKQSSSALLDRVIAASSKESLDAAATRDPRAQALVGSAHLAGLHGYAKSEAEAVKLYRLAANSNPIAQNNLGNLLLSGVANDGKPAPAEAAEMFRRAAKLGHPVAQANLGRLYADGVGVEKDVAKAKEFLTLAAAQGNSDAKNILDDLKAREAAEKWKRMEAAAATGDADALDELAEAYEDIAKKAFDAIKNNQLQAAVNTIVKAPDSKKVRIAEMADEHGMTALHWAVSNRNRAGMRWLLDKGADLELKDDQGRTPLKIALDNQDTGAMNLLIDRGAQISSALPGHDDKLKALKKTEDIVDFMIWTDAPAAAAALYQKECSTEEPIACRKLGLRYNKGDGVPKDLAKAAALFKIACDANDAAACHRLSGLFDKGEGVPKDRTRAVALIQKACAGNYASACTGVGFRYLFGDGLPMDKRKAAEHFEKACNGDDGSGCDALGLMHETNEGGAMDPARAAALYAKGCKLGHKASCDRKTANAAAATTAAKPVTAEPTASELDTRCKAKDWAACGDLGLRYQNGKGVAKDLARAASFFAKACDGGHGSACHALAVLYDDGQGVAKDAAKSASLLDRACKLGDLHVCPTPAAAAPSSAAPTPAAKAATGFAIVKVRLGSDTVASVERDIKARGGTPSVGGTGSVGKFRMGALSGDYSDAGPEVMAVNYDFDAAGPDGRLIAVTIVRKSQTGAPYATLVAARKAEIAKAIGPLQQKSATELTAQAAGIEATLFVNSDTGFLYEVYRLTK